MSSQRVRAALGSRFLRDSTVLQVGSLAVSGFGFLGTIALTHVLGASRQGEFYLAVAAYSLLWFCLNLGLYPVTISQVARGLAEQQPREAGRWLGYLAKVGIPLALLTLGVGWFAAPTLLGLWLQRNLTSLILGGLWRTHNFIALICSTEFRGIHPSLPPARLF